MAAMTKRSQSPRGHGGVGLRPGQIVAGRYRIHRLLGKGGMGEVYRADDLALGDYVALKFPLIDDAGRGGSQHLAGEVAVAQRVSHPNVCRVHDLGHHEGRVFLSMQLVEGETLGAVLGRSVGALTDDEKLRIAHDLCAALCAIHACRIVYRDLKPSNVMLDLDGRAIITDFGLASFGVVTDRGSGTFAYMAPEQHDGGEPSARSDLYALGLVLYELVVGSPAFTADSRNELAARKRQGPPELPGDRAVPEQAREVVVRCLQPDPEDRPESADEVARALPPRPSRSSQGGGSWIVPPETLLVSPRQRPRPGLARGMLAAVLLALVAAAALAPASQLTRSAELGHPPEALEVRAWEVLALAGLSGDPGGVGEERYGYAYDRRQLDHVASTEGGPDRWTHLAEAPVPPVAFWYRRNPRPVAPLEPGSPFQRYDDPPLTSPGMVGIRLDPRGRLLSLEAVPPRAAQMGGPEDRAEASESPDWAPLFAAAGFDLDRFRPVPPEWTPAAYADRRFAWQGPAAAAEGSARAGAAPVRIEAASFQGTPVSFRRVEPWMLAPEPGVGYGTEMQLVTSRVGRILAGLLFIGVMVAATLLARRNLFRRVADPKAAFRLAVAVLAARALAGFLGARHLPGAGELMLINSHLARALLMAAEVWVIYLALEPYVRRFWPELAASWVRLVYGRARDPLVGHHLLVGLLFGTGSILWSRLYVTLAAPLGLPAPRPDALYTLAGLVNIRGLEVQCEALRGLRQALSMELLALVHAVLISLFGVVVIVLLRLLLKRPILSRTVALVLFVVLFFPYAGHPVADLVVVTVIVGFWLVALIRFGFLAGASAAVTAYLLNSHPLTLDPTAWYAPGAAAPLLAVGALAVYGFKISLAGRPALPTAWLAMDPPPVSEPT